MPEKIEVFSSKDAMKEFLNILDRLNDQNKRQFLEGLHTIFFDPLGKRIIKYLVDNDE